MASRLQPTARGLRLTAAARAAAEPPPPLHLLVTHNGTPLVTEIGQPLVHGTAS